MSLPYEKVACPLFLWVLILAGAGYCQQPRSLPADPPADPLANKSQLRLIWLVHLPKDLPGDYWPRIAGICRAHNIQAVVPEIGTLAGYDRPRLKDALAACHARGVQVHAMLLSLYDWSVAGRQPDRAVLKGDGARAHDFLCPTHPANREALIATAQAMVAECPVDGFMFDYIRIGYLDGCYCEHCERAFQRDGGLKVSWPADVKPGAAHHLRFAEWRVSVVTALVADVSKALRAERPGLQLSAAVLSRNLWHRYGGAQDWVDWAGRGLLDFVCPMNYVDKVQPLREALHGDGTWIGEVTQLAGPEGPLPLASGVGYGKPLPPPATVKELIDFGRDHGADGFIYYDEKGTLKHKLTLPGLEAGGTWYYRVLSRDVTGQTGTAATAVATVQPRPPGAQP